MFSAPGPAVPKTTSDINLSSPETLKRKPSMSVANLNKLYDMIAFENIYLYIRKIKIHKSNTIHKDVSIYTFLSTISLFTQSFA